MNTVNEQLKRGIQFILKGQKSFIVRRMTQEDIQQVYLLERQIFTDAWSVTAFYLELNNLSLVGLNNNELVAYAISQIIIDELHIHNIAVAPTHRRQGYGATLLWLLLTIAQKHDLQLCHLEVRRSNLAAISLYQKFGFKIVGLRPHYYQPENEDALLMTLQIPQN